MRCVHVPKQRELSNPKFRRWYLDIELILRKLLDLRYLSAVRLDQIQRSQFQVALLELQLRP